MQELVRHNLYSKLLSTLRLSSFAGDGLPDRMRSISFALLGLTAAAGLALVATFAQLGFPLLSPVPLPAEPSSNQAISSAEKLPAKRAAVALVPARPAPVHRQRGGAIRETRQESHPAGAGGSDGAQVAPAEEDVAAPVSTPEPSGGNGGGGVAGNGTGGGSVPAPSAAPNEPDAAPPPPAASAPPSAPKPEAIASAPKPEPAPAPGNSSSPAAAEHASERGIEASASHGPPTSAAPPAPEAPSPPGNGLAKGRDK